MRIISKGINVFTQNVSTKTSHYTLTLGDNGALIQMDSALPTILTVPDNATVPLPIGSNIEVIQFGVGKVSIASDSGVTILSINGFDTRTQLSKVTLVKTDVNTWYLSGDTAVSGFKTEWATTTASETITLPLYNSGVFNATVDWGDGSTSTITTYDDTDRVHTYTDAGSYVVNITGDCPSWSFDNTGDILKIKNIISWGNSTLFNGFAYLTGGFEGCANLKSLGNDKILPSGTSLTSMAQAFLGCTSIKSVCCIFDNLVSLTDLGFQSLFNGCTSLITVSPGLFRYNTLVSTSGFQSVFNGCSSLSSIPVDLFKYNTLVSTSGFNTAFYNCISLTTLPADLFRYNTLVSTAGFSSVFNGCTALETLPADLFRYNTAVVSFFQGFLNCSKLQLRLDIFYADGEQATRFLNKSVNFQNCFNRSTFTGVQGTAPDLWNCNFGAGTPTRTDCFEGVGNSETSLTNYADIPAIWK